MPLAPSSADPLAKPSACQRATPASADNSRLRGPDWTKPRKAIAGPAQGRTTCAPMITEDPGGSPSRCATPSRPPTTTAPVCQGHRSQRRHGILLRRLHQSRMPSRGQRRGQRGCRERGRRRERCGRRLRSMPHRREVVPGLRCRLGILHHDDGSMWGGYAVPPGGRGHHRCGRRRRPMSLWPDLVPGLHSRHGLLRNGWMSRLPVPPGGRGTGRDLRRGHDGGRVRSTHELPRRLRRPG